MEIFPFPKIEKKDFVSMVQKEFETFQKLNQKLTSSWLLKFYDDFGTDLRSLNRFISLFDGDYEGYKNVYIFLKIR